MKYHDLKCKNCGKRANVVEICPDADDEYFCSQECIDKINAKEGRAYRLLGVFVLNDDGSQGKMLNNERAYGGKKPPVRETTRDKVEAWLKLIPNELILYGGVEVLEITSSEQELGKVTPIIINGGYEIIMNFKSATWEEDDE